MKLGIVIPTYKRGDGTTPSLLSRALESIKNQTYSDYKVFLIGDKYDDDAEFTQLATSIIDSDKIYYENLPIAVERDKYKLGSRELWCSGGVNATNRGIDVALDMGITHICHLDHDDYWHHQHLEMIYTVITNTDNSTAFIYTCGTYKNSYLPNVPLNNDVIESLPKVCHVLHSSVCINHSVIPFKYRDVFKDEGRVTEADGDMWGRISSYVSKNGFKSYLVRGITCYHPTENIQN